VTRERRSEPLLGWRVWRVVGDALHAAVWAAEWPARLRLVADCYDTRPAAHVSPDRDCECGVYAFKRREDAELLAREKVDRDVLALGRVSLWGRVIETERGFRAERAYPYDLLLLGGDERLARALRSRYAIDVELGVPPEPLHTGAGLRSEPGRSPKSRSARVRPGRPARISAVWAHVPTNS